MLRSTGVIGQWTYGRWPSRGEGKIVSPRPGVQFLRLGGRNSPSVRIDASSPTTPVAVFFASLPRPFAAPLLTLFTKPGFLRVYGFMEFFLRDDFSLPLNHLDVRSYQQEKFQRDERVNVPYL